MPIVVQPVIPLPPAPPSWWSKLTRYEQSIVLYRLRRAGLNVSTWPLK